MAQENVIGISRGIGAAAGAKPQSVNGQKPKSKRMCKTVLGFVPAESPIYAFHPTTRLVYYLFMSFLPLVFQTPELELLLVTFSVGLYIWSGVPLKNLRLYARMMILILFFISFSYIAFPSVSPGEVPIALGPLEVYRSSLLRGLLIYTRILALLFATILYFSTNRERDVLVAFRCLHIPFVVSYFIGLVLRSAGTFLDDYKIVKEAEKARGLDMAEAPFLTRVTHFPMYMIPLFTLAIRRSEDISVGLYAKGTVLLTKNKEKRPDYMRTFYKCRPMDVIAVALIAGIYVVCAYLSTTAGAFALSRSVLNVAFGGVLS